MNRLTSTGETVWNKITYEIYANFNPTITASAGEGGAITDIGKKEVEYAVITQRVQKYIAENVTVKEGSEPTTSAETTEAATTAK